MASIGGSRWEEGCSSSLLKGRKFAQKRKDSGNYPKEKNNSLDFENLNSRSAIMGHVEMDSLFQNVKGLFG